MADISDISLTINVKGINELKRAAEEFRRTGEVSRKLAQGYDAVAAKNLRVIKEARRLKALKKDLRKEVDAYTESNGKLGISHLKYVRIMKEEIRASKEKVLTDRKLIAQEQKKARSAQRLKEENERLLRSYAPITAAKRQYERAVKDVDLALQREIISSDEHASSMRRLAFEFDQFTKGLATGGNQFAKFNVEAYKANQRMKRFASVGMQQAGYQVGDFIVQVQAGTDVLVALGQQGSQFAGIFGPTGAVVGAAIAGATAFGMIFKQYGEAAKASSEDIKSAFSTVPDYFDDLGVSIYDAFDNSFSRIEERYGELIANIAKGELTKLKEAAKSVEGPVAKAATPGFFEQLGAAVAPGVVGIGTPLQGQVQADVEAQTKEIYEQSVAVNEVLDSYRKQVGEVKNQAELFNLVKTTYKEILGISEDAARSFEVQAEKLGIAKAITDEIDAAEQKRIETNKKLQKVQTDAMSMEAEVYEELRQEELKFAELKNRVRRYVIDVIAAAEREQAEKTSKLQNFLQETQNKERLKVLRTINDAEVAEAEKNANLQNVIFMGLAKRRRDVIALISEAEKKFTEEQAKAAEKAAKAQERVDARAMAALQIDRYRAALSKAQVTYGKDSAQARQAELNLVEEQVYQTEKLKGTSDGIIAALIDAALKHTKNKQLLQDQADDAKRLAQNLAEAGRAMDAIANFGLSLEQKLVKVTAENEALKAGLDDRVAGEIALLKLQKQRLITSQAIAGVDRGFLKDTIDAIDALIAKYGEQLTLNGKLTATSTSGSKKTLKNIQDTINKLKEQTAQERKLLGLTGERLKEEEIFYDLVQENKEADIKLSEEKLRAVAKEIAAQKQANEMYEKAIGFVDGMTDAFSDFIANGLDDFKSFVSSIKDMFVRLLADMAAAAIRNRILIPITTGFMASAGSAAAGTAMGTAVGAGGIGATLAAGAYGLGAGASAALGIGGYTSAGLFNIGANAAVATAAGASPVLATIGAAIPPLLAVAAVIALFTSKTKKLDEGLRVTVNNMDTLVESFGTFQKSRLFGLLKGKKFTEYEEIADSPIIEAVAGIQQGVLDAAKALGIGSSLFEDFSYQFQVSLQGLTEEQKMQKLNEELTKMGDAFASLSGHFETMNELLQVAQQRYDLETRLLTLLNDQSALLTRQREIERAATHELNQGTLDQIYALEDAYRGVSTAFATVQRSIEARKKAITNSFNEIMESIQDRTQAASQAVSLSQSILSSLQSAAGRGIGMSREAGLSYLRSLTGQARITDQEALKEALDAVGEPTEDLYGTFVDYQRDFADQSNLISDLEEKAGKQLSADEKILEQLQDQEDSARDRYQSQMANLDAQLEKAQSQLDALNNIDTSVKSVSTAMSELAAAIKGAQAAQETAKASSATASGSKAIAQYGGNLSLLEKYDVGTDYVGKTGTYDYIKLTGSKQLLDAAAIAGVNTAGQTGQQIQQAISNAGYVAVKLDNATRAQQFALGGYHSGGLRMVGERGPELEATGPSRVYSANQTRRMMQNPDLVEAVKAMKEEIVELRNEQRQLGINNNKYTKRTYDLYRQWDTEGLPAERT